MKNYCLLLILLPLAAWSQTQTKSQCMTTIRARSMSITSQDAEKLCEGGSPEVANCAVTKMQGSGRGNLNDLMKACKTEWGLDTPTTTATPSSGSTTDKAPSGNPGSSDKDKTKTDGKTEPKGNFEEI